jgi:hypothetical protein
MSPEMSADGGFYFGITARVGVLYVFAIVDDVDGHIIHILSHLVLRYICVDLRGSIIDA